MRRQLRFQGEKRKRGEAIDGSIDGRTIERVRQMNRPIYRREVSGREGGEGRGGTEVSDALGWVGGDGRTDGPPTTRNYSSRKCCDHMHGARGGEAGGREGAAPPPHTNANDGRKTRNVSIRRRARGGQACSDRHRTWE